jgi:hypothetical protein
VSGNSIDKTEPGLRSLRILLCREAVMELWDLFTPLGILIVSYVLLLTALH